MALAFYLGTCQPHWLWRARVLDRYTARGQQATLFDSQHWPGSAGRAA